MRTTIMILAVLSIVLLLSAGALGLSQNSKPTESKKKAHMHLALLAASLSSLTHILTLISSAKSKKEEAPAA